MKRVQLLLATLFLSIAAQTQAQTLQSPTVEQYRKMALKAVKRSTSNIIANKTTGSQQRLKAYSNYSTAPATVFFDSAMLFYSGTNKSTYNKNEMDFMTQDFNPVFEPVLDLSPYMYRADIMENEYDSSVIFYFDSVSQSIQPMIMTSVDYYAAKQPSLMANTDVTAGAPVRQKMLCAYNASGKLQTVKILSEQMPGVWDTVIARYLVYNAQGRVTHDSSTMIYNGTTFDFMKYEYGYDANGRATYFRSFIGFTGAWEESAKTEISWNAQNKINKVTTLTFDGAAYQPVGMDSLGYNAAGDVITYRLTKELDMNMQLMNKSYQSIHLNAQGLPDTSYVYGNNNGNWVIEAKAVITYNTYGNPVVKKEEVYTAGGPTEVYQKKYYYELFQDNTTSVGNVEKTAGVAVYPNPAAESINIKWKEAREGKAQLQVFNTTGQLMTRQEMQLKSETTVNTASYPAGQYLIIIKDDKGVLIDRQSFIKM